MIYTHINIFSFPSTSRALVPGPKGFIISFKTEKRLSGAAGTPVRAAALVEAVRPSRGADRIPDGDRRFWRREATKELARRIAKPILGDSALGSAAVLR